jgi:hypothetical protein
LAWHCITSASSLSLPLMFDVESSILGDCG